ncbi:MAG: hypothetical protein U5K00_11570 [Melioribacteraceae bacterium]|nr:hypothetical protein [Melioribacteraceae bacterium]
MEKIVSRPILATIVVGGSILLLQLVIYELGMIWDWVNYLKYIAPFIPPYIITTTAKRIRENSITKAGKE